MKARCVVPSASGYENYGGRGIVVCDRWLNSFENFLADMGERPSKAHSIDRYPDNDGNYEPSNCRWATRKQQTRNTRANRRISFCGETLCVAEWAERVGIHCDTIYDRLKLGWSIDRALTEPVHSKFATKE